MFVTCDVGQVKKNGFGRLCGIVREIFMVPEIVVPDSIDGMLILMSSGFVSSSIYF